MSLSLNSLLEQIEQLPRSLALPPIKACIQASEQWLEQAFASEAIEKLIFGRATFVDALLCKLWQLSRLDSINGLALVPVGGYGRGQLQPYSDIDLLFLCHQPLDLQQQQQLGQFVTLLWDVGLEIGQAVRTIQETLTLANQDITIATNLIEARWLTGSQQSFLHLQQQVQSDQFWSSQAFFKAKHAEQQTRHAKFHGTSYNLEPNIKENPGCLRDIQNIGWVAKKHFQVFNGRELVDHGYFNQAELRELQESRYALWRMRCALHLTAKRSENRLLFDYQPQVARMLGYGEQGKTSVEAMMKAFFRQVRRVSELNQMLLQRFSQDILSIGCGGGTAINADFALLDGKIKPLHNRVFPSPASILQFIQLIASREDIDGIDTDTLRQLRNARRVFSQHYWCEDETCRQLFRQLLNNPAFYDLGWDLMHKHGILQAYLPDWDHIVGMMQFDLFHAYTVDEHTHRLVKFIRRYYQKQEQEFPRCYGIIQRAEQPELLFVAAIFHDIAKGCGGDHASLGAKAIADFCHSHGFVESDKAMLVWLVKQHLLMSTVAQRRDIYDPQVVAEFAAEVKSQQHLDFLYALTLADIRATNDNLWNDWKSSLLRELYLLTSKALENGLQCQQTLSQRREQHQQQAMQALLEKGYTGERILSTWQPFTPDYFVRFSAKQIIWHTQVMLDAQGQKELAIAVNNHTSRGGTELILYGKDKFSLFAQVASVLDSRNCSIHDAQIMSLDDGYIFDSFTLLEQDGSLIDTPSRIQSLIQAIHTQLNKPGIEHTNNRRLSRRHRQLKVPTKVRFYPGKDNNNLLELETLDKPGLLAQISHILVEQEISLQLAKITTIGERAEDIFIISRLDGSALTSEQELALKKHLIDELDHNL